MSAEQKLIAIDHISDETAPSVYVQNGLKPFLQMIKDEVCGEVPDLTTRKGRDRIASLAALVSKRKVAVEKPGRDYLRRIKELPKVIEAELREFVKEADALRDEIRRPLTEWEEAEAAKKKELEAWVSSLRLDQSVIDSATVADLRIHIGVFESIEIDGEWLGDYEAEAHRLKAETIAALKQALVKREEYEAQQAELARLRREAEERAEQDRIRLAQEAAVEAERQRVAQEQQAERDAAAKREQDLKDQAAAQEREAENQRLQLKLQAEQAERARIQAEADRVAAEQRAEQERQAAALRAEMAAAQAVEDERRRADEAAAAILRQQQERERDVAHRRSINRAALDAFVAGGMTEECAKQAITLIAERKIPNIAISY